MKKLSVKELQNSKYDKMKNYFCKKNINFFNSDISQIKAYDCTDKIVFLDNIRFEYENKTDFREYNIKYFDKNSNKIEILFTTINEELAIEKFKEIIKGDINEN